MRVGDALLADAGVGVEVELFDGGLRTLPWCGSGGGRGGAGFLVRFVCCGERRDGEVEDSAGQREERGRARCVHRGGASRKNDSRDEEYQVLAARAAAPVVRFVWAAPFGRCRSFSVSSPRLAGYLRGEISVWVRLGRT